MPTRPAPLATKLATFLLPLTLLGTLLGACGGDDSSGLNPLADGGPGQEGGPFDATTGPDGASDATVDGGDGGAGDSGPSCTGGDLACGSSCIDPLVDGQNCGACGNVCPTATTCLSGACTATCSGLLDACGTTCVDTENDPQHCGACGVACGAGLVCTGGACALTCETGETLCASASTGGDAGADAGDAGATGAPLCIDTHADRDNCGGCGVTCAAGQVCAGGVCSLTCAADQVDCNGTCIDPTSSRAYCGATAGCGAAVDGGKTGIAGTVCASGQVCSAGVCALSCAAGLVDCHGICVDPKSNPDFCGATAGCGVTAGSAGTLCTAGQVCTGTGTCQTSCAVDQVQCGTECIDPKNDNTYCGATAGCTGATAGTTCAGGQVCSNGKCAATCATGEALCSGVCVNGQNDSAACGASGNCTNDGAKGDSMGTACMAGQVCSGGTCSITCQTNQVQCGSICIDPKVDLTYCGASGDCLSDGKGTDSKGTTCALGQVCSGGTCQTTCTGGLVACGDVCVNELTDNVNCGGCGTTCAAGTICTAGTCTASCTANLSVCGNACVDEKNDPAHCGSCTACPTETNVAVTDCRAGVCAIGVCAANTNDCNGVRDDGCESNKLTDPNNCNGCGNVCAAGQICTAGACTVPTSCSAILADIPTSTDGVYTIQPIAAPAAFQVYCDMTRDGGGWTLIMKAAGVDGDTTFAYASSVWTDTTTLNETDLTVASGDAKYASYLYLPFDTIRGEIGTDGTPADNYRFSYAVTGTASATALFSTAQDSLFVSPYPFAPPTPPFSAQPNCHQFGINLVYGDSSVRFGWTGNNENDCASNDTAAGFAAHYGSGDHGAGYTCESTECSNGDEFIPEDALLWVK